MLLFPRQLDTDRATDRARQQQCIGGDVVGTIATIATGRLEPDDVDLGLRTIDQQREIGA